MNAPSIDQMTGTVNNVTGTVQDAAHVVAERAPELASAVGRGARSTVDTVSDAVTKLAALTPWVESPKQRHLARWIFRAAILATVAGLAMWFVSRRRHAMRPWYATDEGAPGRGNRHRRAPSRHRRPVVGTQARIDGCWIQPTGRSSTHRSRVATPSSYGGGMRSESEIREVFRLHAEGLTTAAIVRATGISRSHVKRLVTRGEDSVFRSPFRARGPCCGGEACELVANVSPEPYAYLLGQYLGDGHVVRTAPHVPVGGVLLRRVSQHHRGVRERNRQRSSRTILLAYRHRTGVVAVGCYSKHLPCLFPQHGPGLKHTRPIILAPWQEFIAVETFSRSSCGGSSTATDAEESTEFAMRSGPPTTSTKDTNSAIAQGTFGASSPERATSSASNGGR